MDIDLIWDDSAEQKFGVPSTTSEETRSRTSGNKRKASVVDDSGEDDESIHSVAGSFTPKSPSSPMKSAPDDQAVNESKSGTVSGLDVELSCNQPEETSSKEQTTSTILPLCGMEDDEPMLAFLQASNGGDLEKAKLSIMVNADQGYGKQCTFKIKFDLRSWFIF